jgi:HSP20 family protein
MTLTRRSPDRSMPLRNALERLVGDWSYLPIDTGMTELAPPLDVRETNDAFVVEIDLPGVDPKNTEVLVEGRTVTVRGRFAEEKEEDKGNYLLRERRQGQFMRAVALPGMVDVERVTSRFDDGQLTITLPKASQNRARRIEISASGNGGSRGNGGRKSEASSTTAESSARKDSTSGREGDASR